MGRDRELGLLLRTKRVERGWSVETVAALYGEAVRGTPVTGGAIHTMEEGQLPQSPKRRWVLARMFDIAPAVLGLQAIKAPNGKAPVPPRRSRHVDVEEFQTTLHRYWQQGYSTTAEGALSDLGTRINALHDTVLYSSEKQAMKRLLCGYHLQRAQVAKELSYTITALDHLNKAVTLAKEEEFLDWYATALYRRGGFYLDKWDITRAKQNLFAAQKVMHVPPQVKGRILNVLGGTEARIARTHAEMAQAIHWVDLSEPYITEENGDDREGVTLDLTQARYLKNRALALVSPEIKKIHLTDEAYHTSTLVAQKIDAKQKRSSDYHMLDTYIVQVLCYLDQGYHPVATSLSIEAIQMMIKMKSTIYLPTIERIYNDLKASPYGKSEEVAELGLQLLFVQFPTLLE